MHGPNRGRPHPTQDGGIFDHLDAVHAGFPTAVNGVFVARDVFEQHHFMPIAAAGASHQSDDERYTGGLRALEQVSGGPQLTLSGA